MILKKKSNEGTSGCYNKFKSRTKKNLKASPMILISSLNSVENISILRNSLFEIKQSKELINSGNIKEASNLIDNSIDKLKNLTFKI